MVALLTQALPADRDQAAIRAELEQCKVFESWPHPILQLTAGDFRFVDPKSKEASRCE